MELEPLRKTPPPTWWSTMCRREAWAALRKAVRARNRHPADSPICRAGLREFARAVRKALLHGPLRLQLLDDDGSGPMVDVLLREAEPDFLAALVDRLAPGKQASPRREG